MLSCLGTGISDTVAYISCRHLQMVRRIKRHGPVFWPESKVFLWSTNSYCTSHGLGEWVIWLTVFLSHRLSCSSAGWLTPEVHCVQEASHSDRASLKKMRSVVGAGSKGSWQPRFQDPTCPCLGGEGDSGALEISGVGKSSRGRHGEKDVCWAGQGGQVERAPAEQEGNAPGHVSWGAGCVRSQPWDLYLLLMHGT